MNSGSADRYKYLCELGEGQEWLVLITERGFGNVFQALDMFTGKKVAVKKIKANIENTNTKNEINAFKKCISDFTVKYIDAFQNGDETWVSVFS